MAFSREGAGGETQSSRRRRPPPFAQPVALRSTCRLLPLAATPGDLCGRARALQTAIKCLCCSWTDRRGCWELQGKADMRKIYKYGIYPQSQGFVYLFLSVFHSF